MLVMTTGWTLDNPEFQNQKNSFLNRYREFSWCYLNGLDWQREKNLNQKRGNIKEKQFNFEFMEWEGGKVLFLISLISKWTVQHFIERYN